MHDQLVRLDTLFSLSQTAPAICVGAGITTHIGAQADVRRDVVSELCDLISDLSTPLMSGDVANPGNFAALMDSLLVTNPELAALARQTLLKRIRQLTPALDLQHLVRANWSVCISLTEDMLFESAIRDFYDSRPQSMAVTIVDSISQTVPGRSLPVFKLLGNLESVGPESRVAISTAELLRRERIWPQLLRTAPDYARDAPLVLVGTHAQQDLTERFLSLLASQAKPGFSRLFFLRGDPALSNPTVRALCAPMDVYVLDASVRDLSAAVSERGRPTAMPSARLGSSVPNDIKTAVDRLTGLVSVVPALDSKTSVDASTHIPQLIDALFRPASIDWQPFLHNFDLRRSITDRIVTAVADPNSSLLTRCILVRGDAATGKTTLLKRVATEVSRSGILTLWCRRSLVGNWVRSFREFTKAISALPEDARKELKIAVFCDDPWQVRIDAAELARIFESCPCPVSLVFSLRNSDFFVGTQTESALGVKLDDEFELGFELDSNEQELLRKLLVKLGVASDEQHSHRLFSELHSARATDILCSLWYLLPETRFQLAESLRDEYCRLGEARDRINEFASTAASGSAVARRAYEFVTVTSSLNIGLPIEVLVRALGVEYSEWLDMSSDGKPLWGLLYDDQDSEGQTLLFWTRNEVVNKVLLELVNGGVASHAGEVRVLRDLLKSCDVGSTVYREFVVDVLVRARQKLESRLSYQQGLELFDTARAALPYPDRVLEHHKGIWIQKTGGSALRAEAYSQLGVALEAPVYPGSERDARREHIHTSMAATVVDLVKDGALAPEKALELIQDHARHSSNASFFNPHSSHVVASLFFELAKKAKNGSATTEGVGISEALAEIDRALQTIGSSSRSRTHYEKDVAMLGELQRRVLQTLPEGQDLEKWAESIFYSSGQQVGFEAASRRLIDEAVLSGKGKDFNATRIYLDSVIELLASHGKVLAPEMQAVAADLEIQWRVERVGGAVRWEDLRVHIEAALASPRYKDDAIKVFYRAVCLFHEGRFTDANAIFAALRRQSLSSMLPAEPRCSYRGVEGSPRRLQGVLEHKHGQHYFVVQELGVSVLSKRPDRDSGHGSTTHGYLVFSLNGPLAVYYRPEH